MSDAADAPNDRSKERAQVAIRMVREARNASNGHVISTQWVMRDPDLWLIREVAPKEWTALIRRLEWLDGLLATAER